MEINLTSTLISIIFRQSKEFLKHLITRISLRQGNLSICWRKSEFVAWKHLPITTFTFVINTSALWSFQRFIGVRVNHDGIKTAYTIPYPRYKQKLHECSGAIVILSLLASWRRPEVSFNKRRPPLPLARQRSSFPHSCLCIAHTHKGTIFLQKDALAYYNR